MRSRLALLSAAAVVFAPGWYGQEALGHPRGSALAASVMAPTVEEGAVREGMRDVTRQLGDQQARIRRPDITFESVTSLGFGALAMLLLWIAATSSGPPFGFNGLRSRSDRAPPCLRSA
jgi:hypothetical protein